MIALVVPAAVLLVDLDSTSHKVSLPLVVARWHLVALLTEESTMEDSRTFQYVLLPSYGESMGLEGHWIILCLKGDVSLVSFRLVV